MTAALQAFDPQGIAFAGDDGAVVGGTDQAVFLVLVYTVGHFCNQSQHNGIAGFRKWRRITGALLKGQVRSGISATKFARYFLRKLGDAFLRAFRSGNSRQCFGAIPNDVGAAAAVEG